MTNEEVMQLMTDMGLHEGGIENWVMDNAWVLVVNKAIEKERAECANLCDEMSATECNMSKTWRSACRDMSNEIRARGQA